MANIITDTRAALAMSVQEADQLFQRLAEATVIAMAVAAAYDQRLADIKAEAATAREQHLAIIKPLEARLRDYINAHPERFQKPRMRKTEFGQYGLRTVTNLEITDEMAAIMSVKAQALQALVITEKLDKKAIEKAISDGATISGAEIRTGEIVKYDVKKELLDRVKKG